MAKQKITNVEDNGTFGEIVTLGFPTVAAIALALRKKAKAEGN